jgi:molecular chaperone DnaK
VDIHVLQGERELVQDNRSLAKFELVGIAPAPSGIPQIEVSFDMDANGILSVSAKDMLSGMKQAIEITPSTGLSKKEIDQMVENSKQYREDDRMSREVTELKNRIKGRIAATVRAYSEFGRFLESSEQEMVKRAIQKARDIDPEENSLSLLNDVLDQLKAGAEKLTAAIFNSPKGEIPPQEGEYKETDVSQLLKSALDDVKS